ncbi:ImmA/IrrE family metallo-endopeptidase [Candidatus Gottesmanbacteria bacterium]|nr:ImmA/IrrE family metallo-endopeptidase [Candidatus Gottesmanbacteria bacterium]
MKLTLVETQASLVLKEYKDRLETKACYPPIPVQSIAEICYGFSVRKQQFDDETSGKLLLKSKTILVNSRDPFVRQRFTIAHELGHLRIHTKEMDQKYREVIISRKHDAGRLEVEANAFAAELLMPKRLVYEYLINSVVKETGEDLQWLSKALACIPDSQLSSFNLLLFNQVFVDEIELLISSVHEMARIFMVSEDTLSVRLKILGILDRLLKPPGRCLH